MSLVCCDLHISVAADESCQLNYHLCNLPSSKQIFVLLAGAILTQGLSFKTSQRTEHNLQLAHQQGHNVPSNTTV